MLMDEHSALHCKIMTLEDVNKALTQQLERATKALELGKVRRDEAVWASLKAADEVDYARVLLREAEKKLEERNGLIESLDLQAREMREWGCSACGLYVKNDPAFLKKFPAPEKRVEDRAPDEEHCVKCGLAAKPLWSDRCKPCYGKLLAGMEKRVCVCPNGTRTAIGHVDGCPAGGG